jgi:hypothetical protein
MANLERLSTKPLAFFLSTLTYILYVKSVQHPRSTGQFLYQISAWLAIFFDFLIHSKYTHSRQTMWFEEKLWGCSVFSLAVIP